MKKNAFLLALCAVLFSVSFIGCEDDDDFEVRYTSNGATVGTVPVDEATYKDGDLVTVKDNDSATPLQKNHHRFVGWTIRGDSAENPIVYTGGDSVMIDYDNIIFVAKWEYDESISVVATSYKVMHYCQNIDDDDYTLRETKTVSKVQAGDLTTAVAKDYPGFTAQEFEQKTIADDNSTVVEIYYDRKPCTLSYNANAGEEKLSLPAQESCRYEQTVTVNTNALSREDYTFFGWSTTQNEAFVETDTEAASAATEYGVGVASTIKITADTVLYAVWVTGTVEVPEQESSEPSTSGEANEGGSAAAQVAYTVRHLQENVAGGGILKSLLTKKRFLA